MECGETPWLEQHTDFFGVKETEKFSIFHFPFEKKDV
jgi:hypothetical protein